MHKHAKRPPPPRDRYTTEAKLRSIPPTAYVQAYESQLMYDREDVAEELYSKESSGMGLMRWQGDGGEVWADRHDILHLLSELPTSSISRREPSPTPSSSSSWSSLPSDLEETFHLSDPEEIEAYEKTKKAKWMEQLRESRLREREEEDRQSGLVDEKGKAKAVDWPENEIPPHAITTLMSHTATSLLKSPNPKILESRILLNHATDERFDFLKGRWKLTWERTKKDARAKMDIANGRAGKEQKAMSGLVGAYDSDSEESASGSDGAPPPPPAMPPPVEDLPPPPSPTLADTLDPVEDSDHSKPTVDVDGKGPETRVITEEAEKQRFRRLKAEEWKRKRSLGNPT